MSFTLNSISGTYTIKRDGNLSALQTVPGNVVLVTGTAPAGPVNQVYIVRDPSVAQSLFDPDNTKAGTLLTKMYEVLETAQGTETVYVALYRIAGTEATVNINGWRIEGDLMSDSNYVFNYQFDYETLTHSLKILYVYSSDEADVIFDNNAGIDTGAFKVTFFQDWSTETHDIGSADSPDYSSWGSLGSFASAFVIGDANETITAFANPSAAAPAYLKFPNFTVGAGVFTGGLDAEEVFFPGDTAHIETSGTGNAGNYLVAYAHGNKVFVSHKWNITSSAWEAISTWNNVLTADSPVVRKYATILAATTGIGLNNRQLYAALVKAYSELETANINGLVAAGTYADADFNAKAYIFEHLGDFHVMWATGDNTEADETPSAYALHLNGVAAHKLYSGIFSIESILDDTLTVEDVSDIAFEVEVNFAHQMATYLHKLSLNSNEARGTMAMTPPASYGSISLSRSTIYPWIGKAPRKNAGTGAVITDGTGLLGFKYLAGSTDSNVTTPGFFATSNGLPTGTVEVDDLGARIDIGRYLDIVAFPILIQTNYKSTPYVTDAAAAYAGFVLALDVRQSTSYQLMPGRVRNIVNVHNDTLGLLVDTGYVAFSTTSNNELRVADAPTAALVTSDWRRLLTNRIAAFTIEGTRAITDTFLGKLQDGSRRLALEEQIKSYYSDLQKNGYLKPGSDCKIRATAAMEAVGDAIAQITLYIGSEFRRIILYISLKNS